MWILGLKGLKQCSFSVWIHRFYVHGRPNFCKNVKYLDSCGQSLTFQNISGLDGFLSFYNNIAQRL